MPRIQLAGRYAVLAFQAAAEKSYAVSCPARWMCGSTKIVTLESPNPVAASVIQSESTVSGVNQMPGSGGS